VSGKTSLIKISFNSDSYQSIHLFEPPGIKTEQTDFTADHPDYVQTTPEQYISSVMSQFEEASASLQASGLHLLKRPVTKCLHFVTKDFYRRKVPINTLDLINNYAEEVVTLKLESFRIKK
jgi:hypothetical protein